MARMTGGKPRPAVGIGYRRPSTTGPVGIRLVRRARDHRGPLHWGEQLHGAAIFDLVGRIPRRLTASDFSIGTDTPLDLAYLDKVAAIVERLQAPAYSEHLAFTRAPGRDLANLLPLPKTEAVAELIITKVRTVQARVPVPFLLENISYLFEWPDSDLSDAEFLNLICRETGAGVLLDVENLFLNAHNHGFDPYAFLDALPADLVKEVHVAGGMSVSKDFLERPFLADSHSHPVPDQALDLLDRVLARHDSGNHRARARRSASRRRRNP